MLLLLLLLLFIYIIYIYIYLCLLLLLLLLFLYICPDIMDHDCHLRDHSLTSRLGNFRFFRSWTPSWGQAITESGSWCRNRHLKQQIRKLSQYPSQLCLCMKIWRLKSSWNPSDVLMFFDVFLMFLLHLGLAIYRIYRFDQLFRHRKFQPSRSETGRLLNTPVLNVFFFYPEDWAPQNPSCLIENMFQTPTSMAESCSYFQISYPQAEEILESYRSFEDIWLQSKTRKTGLKNAWV